MTTTLDSHVLGGALREQLGEILVRKGRISRHQLEQAVTEIRGTDERLGQYLVRLGWIYEDDVAHALAEQFGSRYVTLGQIDRQIARILPEELARRLDAVVVNDKDGVVIVAVADPTDVVANDDLRMALGQSIELVVAERAAIRLALNTVYAAPSFEFARTVSDGSPAAPDVDVVNVDPTPPRDDSPAVEAVNALLTYALEVHASDLHFVSRRDDLLVRARVDGVLRDVETIALDLRNAVIARLKVMGQLDITERRLPQDGRVSTLLETTPIDLRIAVLPGTWGENAVLRILYLDKPDDRRLLPDLELDRASLAILKKALATPSGAIVVCGPTGSGKTTTLYASLDELNDGERAIVTIEDPVEAALASAIQIEVNQRANLTFARGLRTVLRADPDVILVGEMRDEETAAIAFQAAMTGHLVLSSVHAASATAAVERLVQMGVPRSILRSALRCIVSQRLVRRLCDCRLARTVSDNESRLLGVESGATLYDPLGCSECGTTGYRGRIGVYDAREGSQLLDAEGNAPEATLEDAVTLRRKALALCAAGLTSIDEVHRVCGVSDADGLV